MLLSICSACQLINFKDRLNKSDTTAIFLINDDETYNLIYRIFNYMS